MPIAGRYVHRLLALADTGPADTLYDLGCGDGRVVLKAVTACNVRRAVGYDVSRFPLGCARIRAWLGGASRVEFQRQDVRTCVLPEATVVYMYLMPPLVELLAGGVLRTLSVGTRIICPCFPIDTEKHSMFRLLKKEKIGIINAYLYERV